MRRRRLVMEEHGGLVPAFATAGPTLGEQTEAAAPTRGMRGGRRKRREAGAAGRPARAGTAARGTSRTAVQPPPTAASPGTGNGEARGGSRAPDVPTIAPPEDEAIDRLPEDDAIDTLPEDDANGAPPEDGPAPVADDPPAAAPPPPPEPAADAGNGAATEDGAPAERPAPVTSTSGSEPPKPKRDAAKRSRPRKKHGRR